MGTQQAFCGLRMKEAQAIRSQDVDWMESTITVANTERHKVKTDGSERTIPAPVEAMDALKQTFGRLKVMSITGELFPQRTCISLSGRWAHFLGRAAKELNNAHYREIPAKRLRSFFATMASRLECSDRLIKATMGHVPGDMLGRHYRRISLSELRAVSDAMDGWRSSCARNDTGNKEAVIGSND